jgi:xanthine dehydrogenase accessory factor
MYELEAVVRAWEREKGECLLASVVKTTGSTYRRPGARMLLSEQGWLAGGISGGCLERDVLQRSWWHTSQGSAALVVYDSRNDDQDVEEDEARWGLGLGCNGSTSVLLERVDQGARGASLRFVRERLAARRRGVLATVIDARPDAGVHIGQRLMLDELGTPVGTAPGWAGVDLDQELAATFAADARSALIVGTSQHRSYGSDQAAFEVFYEVIAPPPPLIVFGGGLDVLPLIEVAKLAGWQVTVVQSQHALLARARFGEADRVLMAPTAGLEAVLGQLELRPHAAAVVMSHNVERDRAALEVLVRSQVGYIGVLGPRQRTDRLLGQLGRAPSADALARIHAPIGLDIGAEGPHQIALAIGAEVQAFFASASLAVRAGRPREPAQPRVAAE